MSAIAGQLLWRRIRFGTGGSFAAMAANSSVDIDTGVTQVSQAFPTTEPPMGSKGTVSPADGTLPASRIQVQPMSPLAPWTLITHDEPYFNTTTGTIHVKFRNGNSDGAVSFNVLIWDPHTLMSPGNADTYHAGQ